MASKDNAGVALLESKLRAPRRRTEVVRRERLAQRIDRQGLPSLALVSAPAGFGKTTLLMEWLAEGPAGRVAWLSLDRRDSDPSLFWAYVVAALRKVDPDIGTQALATLQATPNALDDIVGSPGTQQAG